MEEPEIIYEDDDFLALNKPAGMLVHATSRDGVEKTLVDWLLGKYPEIKNVGDSLEIHPAFGEARFIKRPGIVHRLDKDTSGVMIAAKNQKAFEYFKNLFSPYGRSPEGRQGSQIKKTYLALAIGEVRPPAGGGIGTINKPIRLKNGSVKRTVWEGKDEKEAITEYKVIDYLKIKTQKGGQIFSLLEVSPKTGRTHQIRVHLASIGHPIIGDRLYGGKKSYSAGRQFLHAQSIEFTDMSGKRMKIEAGLPEDLRGFLQNLVPDGQ
jgi:23S rRNA pseudouridine1911/1915/1917 synthase